MRNISFMCIVRVLLFCFLFIKHFLCWSLFPPQVLVRLVGADDHIYPNFIDVMQWLADSNLLEMILDKLSSSVSVNDRITFYFVVYLEKK